LIKSCAVTRKRILGFSSARQTKGKSSKLISFANLDISNSAFIKLIYKLLKRLLLHEKKKNCHIILLAYF